MQSIGESPWEYSVNRYGNGEPGEIRKDWLTALMDMPEQGDYRLSFANSTLVRVPMDSEGCQVIFEGRFVANQLEE